MALLKTTLPSPDWIHDAVFNLSPPFICLSTGALSMSGYFFFVIGSNFFTLNNEPLPHLNAPVCPSLFPSLLWRLFLSQVFAAPEKLQRYGELFHLHQSLSASICISQVTAGPPSNTSKAKLASNPLHPRSPSFQVRASFLLKMNAKQAAAAPLRPRRQEVLDLNNPSGCLHRVFLDASYNSARLRPQLQSFLFFFFLFYPQV